MAAWFRAVLAFLFLLVPATVFAAPQFPALTGRVVDDAGILSPQFKSALSAQLAAHEKATTNQVVVVTLGSLQGYDISDYGYQLGRHWGIGQKGRNNGVLLIVAPNERKVRIEVGYGLEGALTDAISRDIIERAIKPPFRQRDYEQGIRAGVGAILAALGGEYQPAPAPVTAVGSQDLFTYFIILVAIGSVISRAVMGGLGRVAPRGATAAVAGVFGSVAGIIIWIIAGSLILALIIAVVAFLFILLSGGRLGGGYGGGWGSGGGGGWSGGDGGGFSGGGGSFGGGGASGDW